MIKDNSTHKNVTIYPAPAGEKLSEDYTLTANGEPMPVYSCRVSAVPLNQVWPGYQRPMDQTELAAFAYFDNAGATTIRFRLTRSSNLLYIRPLSRGIKPTSQTTRLSSSFQDPDNLPWRSMAGTTHCTCSLTHRSPLRHPPDAPDVLFFGPGVHHPGKVTLESHQTVYVAGGAVVYGSFHAQGAHDIQILGRGIIDVSEAERGRGRRRNPPGRLHRYPH